MLGGYIMGYRFFMLNILAFTLALGSLLANAQPILPISPMIPGLISTPAQQEQDEKLTLDRAVDFAMRNHPLIRAAASGREIVDAQLSEAQAGHWPLFQFSEIFTHSNNPVFVFGSLLEQSRFGPQNFNIDSLNNPSSLSNFRTALIVRMPIFQSTGDGYQDCSSSDRAGTGRETTGSDKTTGAS
jgi:outer membrane protein TolC